jgi:hypothetical protein
MMSLIVDDPLPLILAARLLLSFSFFALKKDFSSNTCFIAHPKINQFI